FRRCASASRACLKQQLASARLHLAPPVVDEPGDVLNQLVRDVDRGRLRNQQGPRGETSVLSGFNTANDRGLCHVTPHLTSLFTPQRQVERGSLRYSVW